MRNWRIISDGDTFESLVGTLLQVEIPGVIVFGRHGADSGLDSISSDRTHVYQAKFHADEFMASAIISAKKEFNTIKSYRDLRHKNFKYWEKVTDWTLIGNFRINPNDEDKWTSQIVPLFNTLGITAHFKGEEQLDLWLDRNPEIDQSFFGGRIRTLMYPAETYFRLSRRSRHGAFFATEMIGRDSEIKSVLDFAEAVDLKVLAAVGAYCSGKTRFLYEAMVAIEKKGWRVFWGLPESMAKTDTWFNSSTSAQKTCVFLDDPKDVSIIDAMLEQLSVNERSNWKLIFSCSREHARILSPEITTDARFCMIELPMLSRDDIGSIIKAYPGVNKQTPYLDGIADMARGMPSLVCLMLEFYRNNQQLALASDSLELMDLYVSRNLKILDRALRDKALLVLRWVSAWDVISINWESEDNCQLRFLQMLGVTVSETKQILRELSESGIIDAWESFGNDCFRVQPALVRRHIIGSWLLEKNGDSYRVGSDGKILVGQLLKGGVPYEDKIFQAIPVVLESYLQIGNETSRLFRPVFEHLNALAKNGDIETQFSIIEMLGKIGRFDPEATFLLLRNIFSNPRPDSKYIDRWTILHASAKTLSCVAEYVRERPVAVQFVQLFKDIYEVAPDENGRPNSKREEIAKIVSAVVNHFGELRYFPDIAQKMVLAHLKDGDMAFQMFEQMLARQMLTSERQSFESFSYRTVTFLRRAILCGSPEWNRAISIRDEIMAAIKRNSNVAEREALWSLFRTGYQFAHNLCGFIDHRDLHTKNVAQKLVENDLLFLKAALEDSSCFWSIRELQLMREVWEWEYSYGSRNKFIAEKCENLFVSRLGFPFHNLTCLHSKNRSQFIKEVASRFLQANSADEIELFLKRAAEYCITENNGKIKGLTGCSFDDIAYHCVDQYHFNGDNPISIFTKRCLNRFDKEHPLSVAFATTQIRNYIRKQKACLSRDDFAALYSVILSEVKDQDHFLMNVYWCGASSSFGSFTDVELDHMLASRIAPIMLARILPPWIVIDRERILTRLTIALDESKAVMGNSDAVMEAIVDSFYWAVHSHNELGERDVPLDWMVEKFNAGYVGAQLLTKYCFVELAKLKSKKLGMLSMLRFVEAWIKREHSGVYDHLYHDEFKPQMIFVIDDVAAFNKVCDLMFVEDCLFVRMDLGRMISALDPCCENILNYIVQYLGAHSCNNREELSCLARMVAHSPNCGNTKAAMKMICDRCVMLSREDRTYVYHNMMPNEHGASWTGNTVPQKYIDAQNGAQALYDGEPEDSPLKEFYEYCIDRAVGVVSMIRNEIEEREHE